MVIAYGDTLEAASDRWGFGFNSTYFYSSQKLVRQHPKRIGILVSYLKGDQEKNLTLDSAITWSESVCNHCSGSAPSFKDQMVGDAGLTLDLARLPL